MRTYIGIDLGTSGAKLLLVSADGSILAENTQGYPVFYPRSGWSEQNPEDWFAAAMRGMKELLRGQDASAVAGISFGGQMHGLVALDKKRCRRPPRYPVERRQDGEADGVSQRGSRQGKAVRLYRQYRVRGLYRAEDPVDAGERAGKLCAHR